MRPAFLKDDAFLSDVRSAPTGRGLLHVWWLGQSGFLLQHDGRFMLMDPYLSESLTRKYAGSATPHVRMSERVVDPALLAFVSTVTCSHAHTDHMDPDTIRTLLSANPRLQLVVPEALRASASERLGVDPSRLFGMRDGVSRNVHGFEVSAIPSAHDGVETDESGNALCLGYVVHAGPWRVYHSGDTRMYDGLQERLAGFDLHLGLLPINGWAPERGVKGNLDIGEAVSLGLGSGMRLVVPHHFDMFEFNTADPEAFRAAASREGLPVTVLRPGERLTLDEDALGAERLTGPRRTR
jgi:L-ascorbate metabolism protein UlaG (beta-lactamase superfamily)